MNLAVISHTRHFVVPGGTPLGWGPTVRELDALSSHFDHVYHLAYKMEGTPSEAFIPYSAPNVEFVPLSPAGGTTVWSKMNVLFQMPANLRTMFAYVKKADAVQIRVPTGFGLYALPLISRLANRSGVKLWVKYAGNWVQKDPPLSYQLQRWFLKNNFQKSVVTINGTWPDQPRHCLSFENPCLTSDELMRGRVASDSKNFDGPLTILFVGRLEEAKGLGRLLRALSVISEGHVEKVIIVGEGQLDGFRSLAKGLSMPVIFTGGLSRGQLNDYYEKSHLMILPSDASEGFPKVIAEAACYGCVPLVSDVSAVSQYVNDRNGHIFSSLDPRGIAREIESMLQNRKVLKEKSKGANDLAAWFSYERYCSRIMHEVLDVKKP